MSDPNAEIAAFVAERNEVLRSMDLDRVIAFYRKHNPEMHTPARELVEVGMHKARVNVTGLTNEERDLSRQWLAERGYWHD